MSETKVNPVTSLYLTGERRNGRDPNRVRIAPPGPERLPSTVKFDPKIHLKPGLPERIWTLEELGLSKSVEGKKVSPVALTSPFDLFTEEAVIEIRRDILSTAVLRDCTVPSRICAYQGREFTAKLTPFVFQAYKHPETLAAMSRACGIELEPIMDLEIGHTNYQLDDSGISGIFNLKPEPSKPYPPGNKLDSDDTSVVNWHYDGYPWVSVMMLSDMTNAIDGETWAEKGDKSILKVEGCKLGQTYMMQGGYVRHLAAKAHNAPERLTMVTSFKVKDPTYDDCTDMHGMFEMSTRARLNAQVASYRLKLIAGRLTKFAEKIDADRAVNEDDDPDVIEPADLMAFINEQCTYLQATEKNLIP